MEVIIGDLVVVSVERGVEFLDRSVRAIARVDVLGVLPWLFLGVILKLQLGDLVLDLLLPHFLLRSISLDLFDSFFVELLMDIGVSVVVDVSGGLGGELLRLFVDLGHKIKLIVLLLGF